MRRYKNDTTPWDKSKTIKLFSVHTSRQYGNNNKNCNKNVPLGQNRRRGRPCNDVLVAHLKKIITKFWLKIALPLLSSHINEANKPSTSKNGTKIKRGRYLRKSSYKELKYKKR